MAALPWLNYSGQTTDELIGLEDRFRTDSIVTAFDQALERKALGLGGVSGLSLEERTVLAVEALEGQVNNGGFDQFLFNEGPEIVGEVVQALKRIGRADLAQLTQRAIELGVGAEALEQCDAEYFRVAGDLAEPLLDFMKAMRTNIALP